MSGSDQPGVAFDDVLEAARAGAAWAFEGLFVALGPPVAAYLRSQGADDPDGVANDVFLRAFTGLERFTGDEAGFRSWVFTIAHHRLIDERRARTRRPVVVEDEVADGPAPGGSAEDGALRRLGDGRVVVLLATLAPDQRDVLLLRIVADLTVDQVAVAVGKRPGAVKALQRRGLQALRRELERSGVPL